MNKSSLVLSFKKELLPYFCLFCVFAPPAQADLKLHRVMLSAAGVGYFELNDQAGPGTLSLDVPLDQVDDVLSSLVVFDDQGSVGSIDLPGQNDAHRAFADVPFAQASLNSPLAMLGSLRGEEVAVEGPQATTGRIVSALSEPLAAPIAPDDTGANQPASRTRVTLLTDEGFRQFILEDAASVRLTNAALAARVGAALDAARTQAASSFRHLTLRLGGQSGRVTVGYVVAAPLWKATYRVVLPASGADHARVQGWAVLENQSGQDWKDVDLTLQSGNPVTFHQAIYASYYADRPEVPVDVIGRVLPDADERVIASPPGIGGPFRRTAKGPRFGATAPYMSLQMAPPAPADIPSQVAASAAMAQPETQAAAAETMLDTTFHIATPIDLPRGHTASVPILDREMKAEQLDWLQAGATRPITALRLTNDGEASLPPGILTLYTQDPTTGAAFAGDARLSGLPAGQTRLLGFAEDLRTTATRSFAEQPETLVHVTIAHGLVERTVRHRLATTVELTGPAREPRKILVEFPRAPDTVLSFESGPIAGMEQTATTWRVPISLAPGQTRKVVAYADTTQSTEENLLQDGGALDETVLAQFTSGASLDTATRASLQPVIALQATVSARRAALKALTGAQDAAAADEERIRNNLRVVAGPGDLHEKLLAQLADDEARLGDLRAKIAAGQAGVGEAQDALADAVGKLSWGG